jgi:hypothetical protein
MAEVFNVIKTSIKPNSTAVEAFEKLAKEKRFAFVESLISLGFGDDSSSSSTETSS